MMGGVSPRGTGPLSAPQKTTSVAAVQEARLASTGERRARPAALPSRR